MPDIQNKPKLIDRFKNLFVRKTKDKVQDDVKQQIDQQLEKYYDYFGTRKMTDLINETLKTSGIQEKQTMLQQKRFRRYSEYETIIQNISEQKKQLIFYYDMVINPEVYTEDFLKIEIDQDISKQTQYFTPSDGSDTFVQKEIDIKEYVKQFMKTNQIYDITKKQIYDALLYGDQFVEIIEQDYEDAPNKILMKDVQNEIHFKNIPPSKVVKLQVGNETFGYIVLPQLADRLEYDEERLVIDFLLRFVDRLDPDQLKIFSDTILNKEQYFSEMDILMDIEIPEGKRISDLDTTERNSIVESLNKSEVIKDKFLRKQKTIIEQSTFNYSATGQQPFIFQIDLTPYLSGGQTMGIQQQDVDRLMEVDSKMQELLGPIEAKYVQPQNMVHYGLTDYQYYPYGQGILEPVRSLQSLIMLLEYSMVIYRLIKAPDRKKYVIDITGIPKDKIPEYIKRIKNELKSTKVLNTNGGIDENQDLVTMVEDYFVLRKNGTELVDVQNMEGGQIQSQVDDMDYWHKKLLQALGLPPSYLGFQESLSGNQTVLSIQDQRVQRTIMRYQSDLNSSIEELIKKSFDLLQQHNDRYTYPIDQTIANLNNKYSIILNRPQTVEQQAKAEAMASRLNQISTIYGMTKFPVNDLLIHFGVFDQNDIDQFEKSKKEYIKEHPEEQQAAEEQSGGGMGGFPSI